MKPILLLLSLPLLLAGCATPSARPRLAAPGPSFSPQAFFTGATVGDGLLRIALSRARPVHVRGNGHVEADGTLVLVQRISQDDKPPRSRTWRLRPIGAGRFSGTLTDATGPVLADTRGNTLHVRYPARGGVGVEQWLYLQPDGTTAINRLVARKFGIPVATLHETIRRVP